MNKKAVRVQSKLLCFNYKSLLIIKHRLSQWRDYHVFVDHIKQSLGLTRSEKVILWIFFNGLYNVYLVIRHILFFLLNVKFYKCIV